jgi:MFS family permease
MAKFFLDLVPLRENRNFRLLYLGQFVSLLGSNLTLVAVPYQVYRDTHSSLWVGIASLIQLPFLIFGALAGGAYGDRFDKRALFGYSTLVMAVISVGLAINASSNQHSLGLLIALAALWAGVGGFSGPLRSAAIPYYVGQEKLPAAYGLMQLSINIATIAGPALAGLLLAVASVANLYYLDALTFVILAVATVFMTPIATLKSDSAQGLFRSIANGFGYIRHHRLAQAIYLVDLNANFFGLPRALFPAVALGLYHAGPQVLGLLYSAPGVGAVLMALVTGWLQQVKRPGRLIALAVMGWGLAMALFGVIHIVWIGLICLAVAGAMDVISTVLRNVLLQAAITDEFRTRVSSIQMAVVTGGPRLGDAESGIVASLFSTEISIVSGGLACIAGVFVLSKWRPELWRQNKDEKDAVV